MGSSRFVKVGGIEYLLDASIGRSDRTMHTFGLVGNGNGMRLAGIRRPEGIRTCRLKEGSGVDRGRAGSASLKFLWSGPRFASQLATVDLGSGSSPNHAAWPPLRCGQTARSAGRPRGQPTSWSQAGALVARGADRELGGLLLPAGRPLYNKRRQLSGGIAIYAKGNLGSANQAASADGWRRALSRHSVLRHEGYDYNEQRIRRGREASQYIP